MGRPSLAAERTKEILDAFERCVGKFGLEGSSLERIAEEAGMKRSILRHYVGNREELIHALAERVVAKYKSTIEAYLSDAKGQEPVDRLMGFLFPNTPFETAESLLVVESLIAAGEVYPDIGNLMRGYIDGLVEKSANLLKEAFPASSKQNCWSVAYGVVSICFNQESLTPLSLPPKYTKAAKACAMRLIDSLKQE